MLYWANKANKPNKSIGANGSLIGLMFYSNKVDGSDIANMGYTL